MTSWIPPHTQTLPQDAEQALLVGRVWSPTAAGPAVVAVRGDELIDLSTTFPTMRDIVEHPDPAGAVRAADGQPLGSFASIWQNTDPDRRADDVPHLLSPIDLQVIKAAGVTFAVSMLERVIEERAHGDAGAAEGIRANILSAIGGELVDLVPGSSAAARLKEVLLAEGMWSQYLEVGIGPDAEIFTKAPVLSSVGSGSDVGVLASSTWNNPEPEIVVVASSSGSIVGATLGNDVNLRDVEGRSALLLGRAKDNNASASIGPFVRLFDSSFDLDDVRAETVSLTVTGTDGYRLDATSDMTQISRDPADLVAQACGAHHSYPDGLVLYLGTLFAPTADRDEPGQGFTHHLDDVVTIASPRLGALVNRVRHSESLPAWDFGIAALISNLAERGLLGR